MIVRELIYLTTYSCVDIALAVQHLSQQHTAKTKTLFTCLLGCQILERNEIPMYSLQEPQCGSYPTHFSDSNQATSAEDYISIMEYVWYFYRGPISLLYIPETDNLHTLLSRGRMHGTHLHSRRDQHDCATVLHCLTQSIILSFCINAHNTTVIVLSITAVWMASQSGRAAGVGWSWAVLNDTVCSAWEQKGAAGWGQKGYQCGIQLGYRLAYMVHIFLIVDLALG